MSISDQSLSTYWQYYADRAWETHQGRADEYGLGCEEQLCETLAVIQRDESFDEACRSRLDRMPHNRAKKHRRLRRYRCTYRQVERNQIELTESISQIRVILTDEQFAVEFRLANGESYRELAHEFEVSVTALKVRVCRWRERVRTLCQS